MQFHKIDEINILNKMMYTLQTTCCTQQQSKMYK
jgi:hypothetical protein